MPKPCTNGPDCAHLKTVKGCKFIHNELEKRNALGYLIYMETVSALNQAHCTAECHQRNVGGRMTGMLLEGYDESELRALLKKPNDFAEKLVEALEILEASDKKIYIRVADLMI